MEARRIDSGSEGNLGMVVRNKGIQMPRLIIAVFFSMLLLSMATATLADKTTDDIKKNTDDLIKKQDEISKKTTEIIDKLGTCDSKSEETVKQLKETIKKYQTQDIVVHGTEYSINETSNYTIFVQVPSVNDAVCEFKVFNTTRELVLNDIMDYIPTSDGIYDKDFPNPNGINPIVAGVYRTQVICAIPIVSELQTMYFNYTPYAPAPPAILTDHQLRNTSGTGGDFEVITGVGLTPVCLDSAVEFYENPQDYPNRPKAINYIDNITLYMRTASGVTTTANLTLQIYKYNYVYGTIELLNTTTAGPFLINTTIQQYTLPRMEIQEQMADSDALVADICGVSSPTRTLRFYHSSLSNPSRFTREIGAINLSVSFLYRGSGEIHVNSPVTASVNVSGTEVNYTYFDSQFNQTQFNQQQIFNEIQANNQSTYGWFQKTWQDLASVNSTVNMIFYNASSGLSIWDKLFRIQDEITSVNDTVKALNFSVDLGLIYGNLTDIKDQIALSNNTVHSALTSITNTYLVPIKNDTSTIILKLDNLSIDIQNKYDTIMTEFYNLEQKWLDTANSIISQILGQGNAINRIGEALSITPAGCDLLDSLAGRC